MSERQRARAAKICGLLERHYGHPALYNQGEPVAELVFILLATMTTETNYRRSYQALRSRFPTWDGLARARTFVVERCIREGGLARTKAGQIRALVRRIRADWGTFELGALARWPTDDIRRYCAGLPGIGLKGANCVAAYCFGRDVCPVDTHTYRVAVRLGLIPREASRVGAPVHQAVEVAVPEGMCLAFHLNAVAHGRTRCHLVRPLCAGCPARRFCTAPEAGRYSRVPVLV